MEDNEFSTYHNQLITVFDSQCIKILEQTNQINSVLAKCNYCMPLVVPLNKNEVPRKSDKEKRKLQTAIISNNRS